jgi:squalene-hopene/tetraprenyl-beta-curcumene cyclase
VFYLKYHGYPRFFPLLALSRYKQMLASNDRMVTFGF